MKKCIFLLIGLCASSCLLPAEKVADLERQLKVLKNEVSHNLQRNPLILYQYLLANPFDSFLRKKKNAFDNENVSTLREKVEFQGRVWRRSIDPYRELLTELKKRYDFLSQPLKKIIQDVGNSGVDILFGQRDSFFHKLRGISTLVVERIKTDTEHARQRYQNSDYFVHASRYQTMRLAEEKQISSVNKLILKAVHLLISMLPDSPEHLGTLLAKKLDPLRAQETVKYALSGENRYIFSELTLLFLRAKALQDQLRGVHKWQEHFCQGLDEIDPWLVQKLRRFLSPSIDVSRWESDEGLKQLLGMDDPADENNPVPVAADTLLSFARDLLSVAHLQDEVDALAKIYKITAQQLVALKEKKDSKGERWSFLLQNWDQNKSSLGKESKHLAEVITHAADRLRDARRINRKKTKDNEVAAMYELIDPSNSRICLDQTRVETPEDKAALLAKVPDFIIDGLRNELKRREAGIYHRRTKVGASVGSGVTAALLLSWLLMRRAHNKKRGSVGVLTGLAPEKVSRAQVEAVLRKKADEGTLSSALVVQAQQELKKLRRLEIARRLSGVLALISGLGTAIGTGWRFAQRPRYKDYDIHP